VFGSAPAAQAPAAAAKAPAPAQAPAAAKAPAPAQAPAAAKAANESENDPVKLRELVEFWQEMHNEYKLLYETEGERLNSLRRQMAAVINNHQAECDQMRRESEALKAAHESDKRKLEANKLTIAWLRKQLAGQVVDLCVDEKEDHKRQKLSAE
jgi:vancomycin resistance protein YoaR